MCAALLAVTVRTGGAREANRASQRSLYAAEAGLSDVLVQLTGSPPTLVVPPGGLAEVGTPDAPIAFGPSAYFVSVSELDLRTYAVDSTGVDGNDSQRLQLVLTKEATGFFQFAAFGSRGVVLDSNSFVDSYDSAFGPYDSQAEPKPQQASVLWAGGIAVLPACDHLEGSRARRRHLRHETARRPGAEHKCVDGRRAHTVVRSVHRLKSAAAWNAT
jgi:hypothetical protein